MKLKTGDPIQAPDGTWCLWGEGVPTMWGSSQQAVLSEVSLRLSSHTLAVEEMARGKARWAQVATQAPAMHRFLCKKLGAHVETAAPAVAWPDVELWVPAAAPPKAPVKTVRRDQLAAQREAREELRALAIPLVDEGLSHDQIAARLGVLRNRIGAVLAGYKRPAAPSLPPLPLDGPTSRERVLAAWREGMSAMELATAARVAPSYAIRMMEARGWGAPTVAPAPAPEVKLSPANVTAAAQRKAAGRAKALGPRSVKSAARGQEVERMAREGATTDQISEALGICVSRVRVLRKQAGVLGARLPRAELTDEEQLRSVELYEQGLTLRQIAKAINRSMGAVQNAHARAKVEPRRPAPEHPDAAQIVAERLGGASIAALSSRYGMGAGRIKGLLNRAGAHNVRMAKPCPRAQARQDMAVAMGLEGVDVAQIAEEIGWTKKHALKVLQAADLPGSRKTRRFDPTILPQAIELYRTGKPVAEVAQQLGVAHSTLRTHLAAAGETRPVGVYASERRRSQPRALSAEQDRELLERWEDGATAAELARHFGRPRQTIAATLERLGVGAGATRARRDARDEQVLALLREGLSCVEVAERLGRKKDSIYSLMRRLKVKAEDARPQVDDVDLLATYCELGTIRRCAAHHGLSVLATARRLREMGASSERGASLRRFSAEDIDGIVERYAQGVSTKQIASELGCSSGTVWRVLSQRGVQMRSVGHRQKEAS